MFILANFLNAVAYVLDTVLTIYMYVIIARAILSWVNPDPYNPIVNFLYRATEPVLYRVRRLLPPMGGLDLSPIIVLLAIFFLQKFLVTTIFELVSRLKFGLGG
jgi:YggT family protein